MTNMEVSGFLAPAGIHSASRRQSPTISKLRPQCCAALPRPPRASRGSKRVVTVRAPVVDTRVEYASEAHHWISVSPSSVGMFERAAVAQADMVRHVERQVGSGALHRWVLRGVDDPLKDSDSKTSEGQGTYVVMETYKHDDDGAQSGAMYRWLSAIQRAGPALQSVVNTTLHYSNIFTAKMHDVSFNVRDCYVIVESVTAKSAADADALRNTLEMHAEGAVSAGNCQEFCILQAVNKPGFFKTLEVYKDLEALKKHMTSQDVKYVSMSEDSVAVSNHRSRSFFKPVVFW